LQRRDGYGHCADSAEKAETLRADDEAAGGTKEAEKNEAAKVAKHRRFSFQWELWRRPSFLPGAEEFGVRDLGKDC
jgi:hypothetical protein